MRFWNIALKEKAGNITNMINIVLMGCVTAFFIVMNYMVPAIVLGVVLHRKISVEFFLYTILMSENVPLYFFNLGSHIIDSE